MDTFNVTVSSVMIVFQLKNDSMYRLNAGICKEWHRIRRILFIYAIEVVSGYLKTCAFCVLRQTFSMFVLN